MSQLQITYMEFIDKMENLIQFQDRVDVPADVPQIWHLFLEFLNGIVPAEACALFLVDPKSWEFVLRHVDPKNHQSVLADEMHQQVEVGMFPVIMQRRQPAMIPSQAMADSHSLLIVPLSTTKKVLGAVLALTPLEGQHVTRETSKLLALLTKQCSLVLENSLLYNQLKQDRDALRIANRNIKQLSITDPLTGCYNRMYLEKRLPQEIKRAVRYGQSLSIIMCDIDHFKKVNDTYGHQVGDSVLKSFVAEIEKLIRTDVDWLARYGGEEFLIVTPETALKGANLLAERVRQNFDHNPLQIDDLELRITVSLGATGISPQSSRKRTPSHEDLIHTADAHLYAAKNGGRNLVVSGAFAEQSDK